VLVALVALLGRYPNLTSTPSLTWVISGNRPDPSLYASYPPYIAFDGILLHEYTPAALSRITMMSDDLHQPVRFWDAPDFPHAWHELMQLQVDFINTDHIQQLAEYLGAR